MGISGLLRKLKNCTVKKNLREYRGKKVAVDTYAWLHKIIKGQSGRQMIIGQGGKKYVNECMKRIDKIVKLEIDVIFVFDGAMLPSKSKQQQIRRKRRQENFEKGKDLMSKENVEQGIKKMVQSIDVSPDIAFMLVGELKSRGIKFIIAPYEADAQLAYLSRNGIVDVVITEDSDLLAFGAKKIFYKFDFFTLDGEQICLESIKGDGQAGFSAFTHCMFLSACIIAGCDYVDEIKGVGLQSAQKTISNNDTIKKALVQLSQKYQIPKSYEESFMKAMLTFRFQRVYCPIKKRCVSVNQMSTIKWREIKQINKCNNWYEEVFDQQTLQFALKLSIDTNHQDWMFLGRKLQDQVIVKIAEGQINPITLKEYDEHCLEKLRYQKQDSMLFYKNVSTISEISNSLAQTIYCKGVEKKNYQMFINQQQYKSHVREQQLEVIKYNPRVTITTVNTRKVLKINNDSEERKKDPPQNEDILQISPNSQISLSSQDDCSEVINEKSQTINSQTSSSQFKNKLEQISETMFKKIFSNQYLQAPFAF